MEPKPRRRRLFSVESFGPQVMQLLLHGAKGLSEFDLPWNQAIRLRQRIYQLREAMRREKHELYPLVSKVKLNIPEHPDPRKPPPSGKLTSVHCILGPGDHEYEGLISELGITPTQNEAVEVSSDLSGTDLDSILNQGRKE